MALRIEVGETLLEVKQQPGTASYSIVKLGAADVVDGTLTLPDSVSVKKLPPSGEVAGLSQGLEEYGRLIRGDAVARTS